MSKDNESVQPEETANDDTVEQEFAEGLQDESKQSELGNSEEVDVDLAAQVAEYEAEIQKLKDGFLRAKAESENVARRAQNEVQTARKFAIEGFAKELLSVIDSLEQASKVELDSSEDDIVMNAVIKMREGLALTNKQLSTVMQKFGIAEVEAEKGVKFNPDIHQAISMVPGGEEVDSGHVVDVMQKGYTLNERLLRPAMVVVAQ